MMTTVVVACTSLREGGDHLAHFAADFLQEILCVLKAAGDLAGQGSSSICQLALRLAGSFVVRGC